MELGQNAESHDAEFLVAAFYRFVELPHYRSIKLKLLELGKENRLCGSILLAPEGINSTLAGQEADVTRFLEVLQEAKEFEAMEVKYSRCRFAPFKRWKVRLKREIVSLRALPTEIPASKGVQVPPEEWNELVRDPDTVLIDVRNDFETEYGTFENALNPRTGSFSEFVHFAEANLKPSQRIALFCTGGIRCEKAGAYLGQVGYVNVVQLKGGILNYLQRIKKEDSMWQGNCFVFDDRVALDADLKPCGATLG